MSIEGFKLRETIPGQCPVCGSEVSEAKSTSRLIDRPETRLVWEHSQDYFCGNGCKLVELSEGPKTFFSGQCNKAYEIALALVGGEVGP